MPTTISDVAKQAKVSAATVSRVLQGAQNVRPSTRSRVEGAISELGYLPNTVAQSLHSKRSRTLALLVSDITNPFWTTIARGVEEVAHKHDYSVLLCNGREPDKATSLSQCCYQPPHCVVMADLARWATTANEVITIRSHTDYR